MVSVNPNPTQGFYYYDPMNPCLPGLNSLPPVNTAPTSAASTSGSQMPACLDDPYYKKIRKPYTITKSRESWTEQEHDKFLEALQLFDRDWKKIEAFIGSKTVIQIRSHAQKYFLKVQKNGTNEHVPPPRPKRKAAHPYPQKAPKHAAISNVSGPTQSSSVLHERAYVCRPDSSSALGTPASSAAISSWSFDSVPPVPVAHTIKDDAGTLRPAALYNGCHSSSNESAPRTWQVGDTAERGDQIKPQRVMPDFAKVYRFIGSIFDPKASGHLEKLKQMDPIDIETVLLLMRNLSFNLSSPEFEKHAVHLCVHMLPVFVRVLVILCFFGTTLVLDNKQYRYNMNGAHCGIVSCCTALVLGYRQYHYEPNHAH